LGNGKGSGSGLGLGLGSGSRSELELGWHSGVRVRVGARVSDGTRQACGRCD
jgi:hypothetical protein